MKKKMMLKLVAVTMMFAGFKVATGLNSATYAMEISDREPKDSLSEEKFYDIAQQVINCFEDREKMDNNIKKQEKIKKYLDRIYRYLSGNMDDVKGYDCEKKNIFVGFVKDLNEVLFVRSIYGNGAGENYYSYLPKDIQDRVLSIFMLFRDKYGKDSYVSEKVLPVIDRNLNMANMAKNNRVGK